MSLIKKSDPVFNLTDLNGHNGFAINGINARDHSGAFVSDAGDVNGNGLADLLIGTSSFVSQSDADSRKYETC